MAKKDEVIYFCYNHFPGGQVMFSYAKASSIDRKMGDDQVQTIRHTAKENLDAIKKSGYVSLKMKGKDLVKNEILVYPKDLDVPDDPGPAVLAWAYENGIEPYVNPNEQKKDDFSVMKLSSLEETVKTQQAQIEQLLALVTKLVPGVQTAHSAPVKFNDAKETPHA